MSGTLDINCDMGEGFGNWRMGDDSAVIPLISTANLACGFHAGDPLTMMNTVAMAKEAGVAVGAHPGLPDLLGFGRHLISVSPRDLISYIVYQVGALRGSFRPSVRHLIVSSRTAPYSIYCATPFSLKLPLTQLLQSHRAQRFIGLVPSTASSCRPGSCTWHSRMY